LLFKTEKKFGWPYTLVNSIELFGSEVTLSDVLGQFSRTENCAGRNGGRFLEYGGPFSCAVDAYEIVRPRPFMSCKAHDDDDDDDMILFKDII
jgi:hypothetical protein